MSTGSFYTGCIRSGHAFGDKVVYTEDTRAVSAAFGSNPTTSAGARYCDVSTTSKIPRCVLHREKRKKRSRWFTSNTKERRRFGCIANLCIYRSTITSISSTGQLRGTIFASLSALTARFPPSISFCLMPYRKT